MNTSKLCSICQDDPAKYAGVCKRCYHYMYHAIRQGVRWTLERRAKVELFAKRLDVVARRDNVVHLKRRRAA
jgi:hypothetical protein